MSEDDAEEQALRPEQEEQVRRALRAWRPGPDAMPPDVADRLAAAIEELAADRVVAADRRRRRWPNVLVAAAAVSVVALGVGTMLTGDGGAGDSAATSDAVGAQAESADRPAPHPSADDAPAERDEDTGSVSGYAGLPRLDPDTLRRDVARLAVVETRADRQLPTPLSTAQARCTLPRLTGEERLVLARLEGRVVSVVLGRAADGTRATRVYACDDPVRPLASFVVPSR